MPSASGAAEWFEQDALWKELYPMLFPESRFAAAEHQVSQILSLTSFTGRDVLDLCCGPGRHAVLFAKHGLRVTGVDRTAFLLDEARQRAREAGVSVEWVREDMRTFSRPGSFDLALNLFSSLGYFEDPEADLTVMRRLHENLRPGGTLVIDGVGKELVARTYQPTMSAHAPDGTLYILRTLIERDWTCVRNEWIRVRGGTATTYQFHQMIYSAQELKGRLRTAGFASVRVYGDLGGSVYGPGAQRLVAVAVKAG